MNTTFQIIAGRTAAIAGLMMLGLLAGCGTHENEATQGDVDRMKIAVPIDVAVVSTGALSVERTYSATLEGQEQANIVPKISERVAKVHVQVGAAVPAERLIVTLDRASA